MYLQYTLHISYNGIMICHVHIIIDDNQNNKHLSKFRYICIGFSFDDPHYNNHL